jgi:hypothetical protein
MNPKNITHAKEAALILKFLLCVHIVTCMSVTIDGVWIGNRIYSTLSYSA